MDPVTTTMTVFDMLKQYGPWSLGFVAAWILWKQNVALQTQLLTNAVTTASVIEQFKNVLQGLSDHLKNGSDK